MKIYIDEAGNTGQDLLNEDQPVFVLASHNYDDSQINILRDLFDFKGELHFKNLKDSIHGREAIIKFINHPLISELNINIVIAHKLYVACGHIVDRLIEPVFFDENIDIYSGKQNIILNQFLFSFGLNFWDKNLFDIFLVSFMKMVRVQSSDSIDNFYRAARNLYNSPLTKERNILVAILKSKEQITDILSYIDKFSLDVTLSSFLVLSNLWYLKSKKRLIVFHDKSKQLEFYKDLIFKLTNTEHDSKVTHLGTQDVVLPYQIQNLNLVDSIDFTGIQLADILASAVSFNYNNKNPKYSIFREQIQQSKLFELTNIHAIQPQGIDGLIGMGVNIPLARRNIDYLSKKYTV